MAWSGEEVAKYIAPLKKDSKQPSGVDLTIDKVYKFVDQGTLGDSIGSMPIEEIAPDNDGYWNLSKGAYLVRYGEIVEIPKNALGLVFPRSSLMRIGCTVQTAVWDPGYKGRGVGLLIVMNPQGVRIRRGSRIAQIIFIDARSSGAYSGRWQGEGIADK